MKPTPARRNNSRCVGGARSAFGRCRHEPACAARCRRYIARTARSKADVTPSRMPKSRKATTTEIIVRTVRARLRQRLAQTRGKILHAATPSGAPVSSPLSTKSRARRMIRSARIVRHHDDGLAVLAVEKLQQPKDRLRRIPVEVARRLVADEQPRVRNDRARDRDPLLLSAGELRRLVVCAVGEAHERKRGRNVASALLAESFVSTTALRRCARR